MPNPTASISMCKALVYDELNVARDTFGVFNDAVVGPAQWQEDAIINWIIDSDYEVARTICETVGHPKRNYYISTTPAILANQDPLPVGMIGPPETILITLDDDSVRIGVPASGDWINFFVNDSVNTFGGPAFSQGYYTQQAGRLFFSGVSASVFYATAERGTTTDLISPPEFQQTIIKLALAKTLAKQENYMRAAAFFLQQGMSDLVVIKQGQLVVPPTQAFAMAA